MEQIGCLSKPIIIIVKLVVRVKENERIVRFGVVAVDLRGRRSRSKLLARLILTKGRA
jgi:hypothetical protein